MRLMLLTWLMLMKQLMKHFLLPAHLLETQTVASQHPSLVGLYASSLLMINQQLLTHQQRVSPGESREEASHLSAHPRLPLLPPPRHHKHLLSVPGAGC